MTEEQYHKAEEIIQQISQINWEIDKAKKEFKNPFGFSNINDEAAESFRNLCLNNLEEKKKSLLEAFKLI